MKKKSNPIVFKSASGGFVHTLLEAEKMLEKFRSSNLDFALRDAIGDGQLFVMPADKRFAYCRGSGPVGLKKVRVGHHEKRDPKGGIDFNSPRVLVATYGVTLF